MPLKSVNAESYRFNPSALLSLYEIDSRYIAAYGSQLYFHAGVNGNYAPVTFDGITYTPFPIDVTDMAIDGKGGVPRPKLTCSNVKGFISQYLLTQGDMVGARFIRRRVFARFIDASNFPGGVNPFGTPDATAAYDDEIYFINRKVQEDPNVVVFETASPFEIDNVQLPNRLMFATNCVSIYRDPDTCGYAGVPIMDRFGKSFTAVAPDGYGYTLVDKGIWSAAVTYQVGDYVTIISQGDFNYGDTLVFVCSQPSTVGQGTNPQFSPLNWIGDACPHNLLGCTAHYPAPQQLRLGAYAGIARASFE